MEKRFGRAAITGFVAAAAAVVGLAGVASAGMTGDAARGAGSTAGAEVVAVAQTAQTASWYGRGLTELALGETAQKVDRTADQAIARASGEDSEDRPKARPVGGVLEQVSHLGAEAEETMGEAASTAAAIVAAGSGSAAATLDGLEESLRR